MSDNDVKDNVIIRKMGRKELKEVMKIEQKELYSELEDWQLQQWVDGDGIFALQSSVVLKDGKVIGFTVFEIYEVKDNEIIISLDAMAIKREFQNQGIGRCLLETSLEQVIKHWEKNFKVKGLIIETGTDEAGNFYEKVFSSFEKKVFEKTWSDGKGIIIYFVRLP